MKREKLVKKIAKAIHEVDSYASEVKFRDDICRDEYLAMADVALKELARLIFKTPDVEWGDHDISQEFVEFFAGSLDEFAPLDER